MGRIAELRPRIQRKTANLYDTWFTRRVSIYLTVSLVRFGVTPNQVSAFGALVGVGSCAAIAFGSRPTMLLGVGLLHLYAVLDSVDGELARLTQRFSLMGLFMEDLSAYVMINAVNLAVGWRLYAEAHLSWPLVLAVVYSSFGRNVMPVARRALLKSLQTRRPPLDLPLEPERAPSPLRNFIQENVVHATNQWMLVSALLALAGYHIVSPLLVATVFAAIITVLVIKEFAGLLMFMNPNRLEYELSKIYRAARLPTESATDGLTLAKFSVL